MKNHLVIFAKAPRLGLAKRRLAADIGMVAAWRFQRIALDRAVRTLATDPRWECLLATTGGPARWPGGVRRMQQPRGDLGERMDRVMRAFGPGPVVIVGSDIPDITPRHIDAAFRALGRHDAVFGPADDGGYWLVGLRRRPFQPDLFKGVRWSTRHALADTLANLGGRYDYALLETLTDIDDAESLERWREGGTVNNTRF
jgi:rSAM/selenodomain-associated transferase 1